MADMPFVFVSYARADRERVSQVVDELKKLGIETWIDSQQLVAGESWQRSISDALRRATALLVFISPESMSSSWINMELEQALASGVRVLPVLLRETPTNAMPLRLQALHWFDALHAPPIEIAQEIAQSLFGTLSQNTTDVLQEEQREDLAKALAAQSKGTDTTQQQGAPKSAFVVHGHDDELLREVVGFIEGLKIKAIVMKDVGGAAKSLIDKFFEIGGAARFAIVLLSADDKGASRIQYEEPDVGERALKYRSRQNVILELGYFYGLLGWENVFVLEKAPPRKYPDFERPSDLNGVVFDRFDVAGKWKTTIAQRLTDHGFRLDQTTAPASH